MDQNFLLRVIKCSSIDFLKVIVSYHSQGNGSNFPSHCFYFAVASMTFSSLFSVTGGRQHHPAFLMEAFQVRQWQCLTVYQRAQLKQMTNLSCRVLGKGHSFCVEFFRMLIPSRIFTRIQGFLHLSWQIRKQKIGISIAAARKKVKKGSSSWYQSNPATPVMWCVHCQIPRPLHHQLKGANR